MIDNLHKCGVGPSKISQIINAANEDVGEIERVTPKATSDHFSEERKNKVGCECVHIIRYFQQKRAEDDNFFFEIQIDEDKQARCVFWANGRSRLAYLKYGDVLVFDVNYQTNSVGMSFVPFAGVNHHKQSTLFGRALIADETEVSFIWLFEAWLRCMWGGKPISIITDQDKAMKKAIETVFPDTIHQFCSWHFGRNDVTNMGSLWVTDEFTRQYKEWMHESETSDDFQCKWNELKEQFNLEGSWLDKMFKGKKHWAPIYLFERYFFYTMTSKSESMNSFFDGYINAQTPLSEFVSLYDKVPVSQRGSEEDEDHVSLYTEPILYSHSEFEKQMSKLYTWKMFNLFQNELPLNTSFGAKLEVGTRDLRGKKYHVQ